MTWMLWALANDPGTLSKAIAKLHAVEVSVSICLDLLGSVETVQLIYTYISFCFNFEK